MKVFTEILLIIFAYLLGSIPFGFIFTRKFTGKNIREFGSGNIGSTNVRRVAGSKAALFTQLCDMLKGLVPVAIVWFLIKSQQITFSAFFIYAMALAPILGHNFSIFLGLKGGKGVNTTLGASLFLSPIAVFASVFIYFSVKSFSKYVSLGSICLAISLPVIEFFVHKISLSLYFFLIAAGLIILMHLPNIKRLLKGTENKSD